MMRHLCVVAACCCLCFPATATEWDDIKTQYKTCITVAGLGQGNGLDNPNEWNNAEGLSALNAELSEPHSAMADIYGRIYVADKNANAIRRIDTDGTIHTVAGMNLNEMPGAVTNAGFTGDGPARLRLLDGPQNTYVMPDGTLYVMDTGNHRIRRVDLNGTMTTVINDSAGMNRGLWVQRDGQVIYYCTNTQLKRWTPSLGTQGGTRIANGFLESGNIDLDRQGNIYVSDRDGNAVYRVPPNYGGGAVTAALIVAGTGTDKDSDSGDSGDAATTVGMLEARGIAFHPSGGYFVATHAGGDIWYVDSLGVARLFIQGNSGETHDPTFNIPANNSNKMSEPRSVTVAPNGDVIIASNDAGYIRVVRSTLPAPAPPKWDTLTFVPGSGNRLRWQSTAGQWYLLERSSTLLPGSWSTATFQPASGTLSEFLDTSALSAPRRFYRVHSLRAWPN
jgi:streptogramin lyase